MNATKTRGYAKKLLALVMAMAMVFSLAISASATTTSYEVTFYKEDGSSSMANNAIDGDAVYDSEENTLTIPIKKSFMMRNHPDTGILTPFYGCITKITINDTAVGTAEWDADKIVIEDFTLNDSNSYTATFTVEVRTLTGTVTTFSDMTNASATMTLS